jgi:hypothetical protein
MPPPPGFDRFDQSEFSDSPFLQSIFGIGGSNKNKKYRSRTNGYSQDGFKERLDSFGNESKKVTIIHNSL